MKEKERERWLSIRRFNSKLFSAFNRDIDQFWWSWDDWRGGSSLNVMDEHGDWYKVPRMSLVKTKSHHNMRDCCYRCYHKILKIFWCLPRPLHTKEQERYFKRETWYPLFLQEIKEHPAFAFNAFNPFIVFPRENALLYS